APHHERPNNDSSPDRHAQPRRSPPPSAPRQGLPPLPKSLVDSGAHRSATPHITYVRVDQSVLTSMETGTPLVRTSNAAERRRDCSTTARSFSGSSPRRVKLTLICW